MSGPGICGSLITEAVVLAAQAHDGQVDKLGQPYILHPLAVAASVPTDDPNIVVAALLHDAVEDTWVTLAHIDRSFGPIVCEAVNALTRREGETYREFIARLARNDVARIVKIADLRHNLARHALLYEVDPEKAKSLHRRYSDAVRYLNDFTEGLNWTPDGASR